VFIKSVYVELEDGRPAHTCAPAICRPTLISDTTGQRCQHTLRASLQLRVLNTHKFKAERIASHRFWDLAPK